MTMQKNNKNTDYLHIACKEISAIITAKNSDAVALYVLYELDPELTYEKTAESYGWDMPRYYAAKQALERTRARENKMSKLTQSCTPSTAANSIPPDSGVTAVRNALSDIEKMICRRLDDTEIRQLESLCKDGMPADVLYILVGHCVKAQKEQYGPTFAVRVAAICREGHAWIERGTVTQDRACEYLADLERKERKVGEYLYVLDINGRPAVPSEKRYIYDWIDWDISPDTVKSAKDEMLERKGKFSWAYLDAIIRNWKTEGRNSPGPTQRYSTSKYRQREAPEKSESSGNEWMRKYIKPASSTNNR